MAMTMEHEMLFLQKLNKLGYEPCILSEQISLGQQLIDKFETEASDAFFAVVILSKDDEVRNLTDQ